MLPGRRGGRRHYSANSIMSSNSWSSSIGVDIDQTVGLRPLQPRHVNRSFTVSRSAGELLDIAQRMLEHVDSFLRLIGQGEFGGRLVDHTRRQKLVSCRYVLAPLCKGFSDGEEITLPLGIELEAAGHRVTDRAFTRSTPRRYTFSVMLMFV